MPDKFQKVYKDWANFDQPIMHFKSDIKEGKSRSYQLSIWLGSTKPAEEIINKCTLEWEEEQDNSGFIKMAFKRM
jgi:hypothetical protein